MPRTPSPTDPRFRAVARLADEQGGVVSRRQVYALGLTRWEVRGQVLARRWRLVGDQAVCLHNAEISAVGHRWAAVFQGGPRACLDGASALVASGLLRLEVARERVSVPRGARVRRTRRYDIRQTRRWSADDVVVGIGAPRARTPVAAIRAALWAASDRQAALLLTMVVQQGLARPEDLGIELLRVRRDRRRPLIADLLLDLLGGVRSLGELDFARECRRRGLPEPDRQVARRGRDGHYFLDVEWSRWGVVVEIDGIQHTWAPIHLADALRQNHITLGHRTVLRVPVLGLRIAPDQFFAQITDALTAAGCPLPTAHTA